MERFKNMGKLEITGVVIILLLIALAIKFFPLGIPIAIAGTVVTVLLCFTGKEAE